MESPREPRRASLASMLRLQPPRKLRTSPDVEEDEAADADTPRAAARGGGLAISARGALPTWLARPGAAPAQGRRPVESVALYAVVATLALLAFFALVAPEDSAARFARLAAADAHAPRRLERFNVSSLVIDNMDAVDVAYEYAQPQPGFFGGDRVAAYCVDSYGNSSAELPKATDYLVAIPTDGTPAGVVRVGPLMNMRCTWVLRFIVLLDTSGKEAIVLAQSKPLHFAKGKEEPLQVHLSPARNEFSMRAKWVSAEVTKPIVRFGMDRNNLTRMARATGSTYESSDLCGQYSTDDLITNLRSHESVARRQATFRDPGFIFDAVMTRIFPQKVYYYSVGDEDTGIMSDVFSFQLPPPAGDAEVAIDFAELDPYYLGKDGEVHRRHVAMAFLVFGDLNRPVGVAENFTGLATAASRTVKQMTADVEERNGWRKFVAAFHVGDLSRAMGSTFVWDQFGQLIEPLAARVPYLVAVGNQDYGYMEGRKIDSFRFPDHPVFRDYSVPGYDANGECGVPAMHRFRMPDTGNKLFWYSTDTGLVHHVVLSSEHDFSPGSRMHAWLIGDLMTVDRSKTPWVFLYIHRPLYSSSAASSEDYYNAGLLREALESVLSRYRVDIVFSGHQHSYERSCPVFDELCFQDEQSGLALAPVHIAVGTGGFKRDDAGFYDEPWRAQGLEDFGYSRVHVFNSSHVQIEFVSTDAGDADSASQGGNGVVLDAAWIVSNHLWPNNREHRRRFTDAELLVLYVSGASVAGTLLYLAYLRWAMTPSGGDDSRSAL